MRLGLQGAFVFFVLYERISYDTKTLRGDRTAADRKNVDKSTRRRRRISKARFYFCKRISG